MSLGLTTLHTVAPASLFMSMYNQGPAKTSHYKFTITFQYKTVVDNRLAVNNHLYSPNQATREQTIIYCSTQEKRYTQQHNHRNALHTNMKFTIWRRFE